MHTTVNGDDVNEDEVNGGLEWGPNAVGFRRTFAMDFSRRYGIARGDPAHSSRPILLAIWYPAISTGEAAPLCYGDYLRVTTDDSRFAEFAARLTAYNRESTIRYGLNREPAGFDAAGEALLAERERLPMRAVLSAAPIDGRFPVVFYHPGLGGSYDDNSILCECLASHGYLVVSSAFQPENAPSLHLDWDLNRSFRDLAVLINHLAQEPLADVSRIGIVGQSFGGQVAMAWSHLVNSPVQAVISLDSTVEYAADDAPGFAKLRAAMAKPEHVTAPWLLFAVKDGNPRWDQWDALINTPRWYAGTGHLEHNDFTSQGMLGTVESHPDRAEAACIGQRYNAVCDLTRRFLDGYLKEDQMARLSLMQQAQSSHGSPDSPLELMYKAPRPGPSSL